MRAFLNAILAFIGASALTDDEFAAVEDSGVVPGVYDVLAYNTLLSVLESREAVTAVRDRARYFFLSHNVAVAPVIAGKSRIFIGDVLDDEGCE